MKFWFSFPSVECARFAAFPRPRCVPMVLAFLAALIPSVDAQGIGFSASKVSGLITGPNNLANKLTSLQFGPDNRLYFTQVNGTVVSCNITRQGANNYVATNIETISLIKNIPNYDDDGTRNLTLNTRQTTGILVTGTAANPVIYVSSSDPREGAGSGATDLNLDTNSGVISRLTKNAGGVWEKLDIVRGLPRSEENHASNGIAIDPSGNKLYLAQGGNTNAGSPSNNFAFASETALCAAVLSIDLTMINAMPVQTDAYGQHFLYNIPTVNDPNPSRVHNPDSSDLNDPFGGNDGLNQAKLVEGGPVQVYGSGFRNPYDVLIAKTPGRAGKMYTFDNAANSGWGGYPKNEGFTEGFPSAATNQYVTGEAGTVNNLDNLHLISGPGYYGGHPNPIRANPAGAGWFRDNSGVKEYSVSPTTDWPPVPLSMADPRQGDFRMPGVANGALFTNNASTTGFTEYTASNFGGALLGNIITTQYSTATVQRLIMNADGTQVTGSSVLLSGSAYGVPLDVTAPGPGAAPELAGTIFVAHHSAKGITVMEPTDFESGGGNVCTGAVSYALDEDLDGYSNADEILNGSDPCSPAVLPPDRDGDLISDLLDTDDDNDAISDAQDSFPIDGLNGTNVAPPVRFDFFNELGVGFFNIGFTGVMSNPGEDYLQRINDADIIAGGTAGLFTDPSVGPGSPHGAANSQINAFQVGVNVDEFTGLFRVRSGLGGLLFNGLPVAAQSHGIYIGNGDQDNYLKLAVNAASGPGAIEVVHEENGVILSQVLHSASGLFTDVVTLTFLVDPIAGTVQPGYSIGTGPIVNVGAPIAVGGKILDVLRGHGGMALGLLATTGSPSTPGFNATWDYFEVLPVTGTAAAKVTINSGSGTLLNSSTNTGGSFQVENLSTGGQKITSVRVDLGTAMLPDVVFDPAGTAGDVDGKGFDLDSFNGTGIPAGTFTSPHDGIGSEDGYEVLDVVFGPAASFLPGNLLTFSADIDPTSVKGVPGPGPSHSASVSGLELIGTTVTVTFDDGTVRKIRTAAITGTDHTNKTSVGLLSPTILPTPDLAVTGKISPFATTTQPTVRVSGPAGSTAKVWVFNSALYLDGVANGGYDIDPYESNTVIGYSIIDVTLNANGYVDVPVTLVNSVETGGINYVAAVLVDGTGKRSASSDILVIEYDPSGSASNAVVRVNSGGASFLDATGETWAGDNGFSSGSTNTYANEIAGTLDDALYQSFRFDDSPSTPLDYSFALPNGRYQVKLHFAETWVAITGAGQRVFDVLLEGQTAVDNLDLFAVAGANTAHIETLETDVNDGQLTIGLRNVVQNPLICAIEVYYLGGVGTGPDIEAPSEPDYFTSNNLKAGSLNLVWAASFDDVAVAGYRIFRNGTELGTTALLTLPQTGLTPETTYTYGIEAFDAAGNISERAEITVTTPADQENPTPPLALKGSPGNSRAILSWQPASDDAGVTGYRIYREGQLLATLTALEYTDEGLTNGTLYHYEVIAIDASGKSSIPATIPVRPRALGPVVMRINSGGGQYVDALGNIWDADFGFNTGVADAPNVPIAGTVEDSFYQSRRLDNPSGAELKYTLPLVDGEYELRLHFAEVWTGASTAPGIRVFDVKVENELVLDNFDIFAEAGYATALVVPIPVTVTGGQLTIEFLHGIQNPMVAGIEIYALEPPPPDLIAPTAPGSLVVSNVGTASVSLSWAESSDDVGVVGYQIHRNGLPITTVGTLSFTDGGRLPETLYQYTVSAVDAAGNVSPPAAVSATTLPDTQPPTRPGMLAVIGGNGSAALSWAASADDIGVTGYRISRNGSTIATVTELLFSDTGLSNGTLYQYEVSAIDAAANASVPATGSTTPLALGVAVLRINVGDGNYIDSFGNTWAPDSNFNTGVAEVTNDAITGTPDPVLYQSRRFDRSSGAELKYNFDLPNGNYAVRLHFAEVWVNGFVPGARVFDVSLEGLLALDDFDIFARAGAKTAHVVTLPTTVADGKLNIDFQRVIQNPTLAAIEVFTVLGDGPAETVPPTAPGSLAAVMTTTSAALAWTASTDNTGVAGYRIYRDNVLAGNVTQTSFSDAPLASGTLYQYSVTAFDAAGNTSAPALLSATTLVPDITAPSTPGDLTATPGFTQAVLNWTASTDNVAVTGYRILKNGQPLVTVTSPGYTDINLTSGTVYTYSVAALDAAGNVSIPSETTFATNTDDQPPTAPAGLAAVPGFTGISLSWTASSDNAGVTGYRVYRDLVLLTTVSQTAFVDSGLNPGTEYDYEVVAVDGTGNPSAPASVSAATLLDNQAPTAPGSLQGAPQNSAVNLSWAASTDNVGVTGYQIRRDNVLLTTVPVPGYSDPGLANGTIYQYDVRAVDSAGNISLPAVIAVKPTALGPAFLRVNVGSASPFVDPAGNTWVADYGFNTGYTEASTNAITGTAIPAIYQKRRIDRSSGAELKYEFTVPNGEYEVRLHFAEVWSGAYATGIRVFDVSMEGGLALDDLDIFARAGANKAYVAALPVTISDGKLNIDFQRVIQNPNLSGIEVYPVLGGGPVDSVPPTPPAGLAANSLSTTGVGLAWTASTDNLGVLGYRIYRDSLLLTTVTQTSFIDSSLASGTEYDYSVIAFDTAGNTSAPADLTITTLVPDTTAPSVPADLVAVPGLSDVVLNWTASTDNSAVTGYRILKEGLLLATVPVPGYTDRNLASGTGFDYEVQAFDEAGNFSASAAVSATTLLDTEAPTAPGALAAVPGITSMALSWEASTDNADVGGYAVYRNGILVNTVSQTSYQDSGLSPATQYEYMVVALDFSGNSSVPAQLAAASLPDLQAPSMPLALQAVVGNASVTLSWMASTDNLAVAGYAIHRNGSLIGTVTNPGYADAGLVNGTEYFYQIFATDAAGNSSAAAQITAKPRAVGPAIARVNSGGAQYTDVAGNVWSADEHFSSGSTSTTSNPIAGTLDDTLYQTERYSSSAAGFEYAVDVPNGQYEVRLHFAETFAGASAPGVRVFDVRIEGSLAVDDLDLFARTGANTAYVVTLPATVADGKLNIAFGKVLQNPKVCALEIYSIPQESGPTFEQWLEANSLAGQTTGDSDHGSLDNFTEYYLHLDPNDPLDDLTLCLKLAPHADGISVKLPELVLNVKYTLYGSSGLEDMTNPANLILILDHEEINAMESTERLDFSTVVPLSGGKRFFQLKVEPDVN